MVKYPKATRGFTLIEMLIVAALISLFSALAIFSMDYLVNSSKRKASIADVSTISKAFGLAYFDLSMFPQIGYLSMSKQEMWLLTGNNRAVLPPYFDHMGFDTLHSRAGGVYSNWATGESGQTYLPSPRSRAALGGNPGDYTTKVLMPGTSVVLDWPSDAYGNPYVLYTVDIDEDGYAAWPTSPTGRGTYKSLVVCYGRNGIPGGYDVADQPISFADRFAICQTYALYIPIARDDPNYEDYHFIALRASDYTGLRLDPILGNYTPGVGNIGDTPGIESPGSDDLTASVP